MTFDDDPEDQDLDESFGSFDARLARRRRHRTRDRCLVVVTIAVVIVAASALLTVFRS